MADRLADKKQAAVVRNTAASTDLRFELDKLIKLIVFAREPLENQIVGTGLAYKQQSLGKESAASIQALATSLEKAVNCKIKYDQHLKKEADNLTPEEEQIALIEFFAGLEVTDRRKFLRRLVDRHNALIAGTMAHEVTISIGKIKDEAE